MTKVILDISHHETVTDWKELKENVSFLIIKATQGTDFLDPHCYKSIEKCEKYGIPYWLYCFFDKGNEPAQAKYMVEKTKGEIGKRFVGYCIDCETGNSASNVQKALDYIKKHSKKTMIYTAHHHYNLYKSLLPKRGENCAWWEPRYFPTGPHKGVDLWQYSETYKCSYISGEVDINRIYGDKPLSWFMAPTIEKVQETKPEVAKSKVSYYKKYTGKSGSIVDALRAVGETDTSISKRMRIGKVNGISNVGTVAGNTKMLNLLKVGKLKKV